MFGDEGAIKKLATLKIALMISSYSCIAIASAEEARKNSQLELPSFYDAT